MAIEVEIIPTSREYITWRMLRESVERRLINDELKELWGPSPSLVKLPTQARMSEDQALRPPALFVFELTRPHTLTLHLFESDPCYTEEMEVLSDYGEDLSAQDIEDLALAWRKVGYSFIVKSFGGRTNHELGLLVIIAASVAELCRGHIIAKDDRLSAVGPGVFTVSEFLGHTTKWV